MSGTGPLQQLALQVRQQLHNEVDRLAVEGTVMLHAPRGRAQLRRGDQVGAVRAGELALRVSLSSSIMR